MWRKNDFSLNAGFGIPPFKEYLAAHRDIELIEPFIIIHVNITPKVYEYMLDLENIKFKDGEYHTYCGKIKTTINRFINYWSDVIDESIVVADKYMNTVDKKKLMELIRETIEIQKAKQESFTRQFLPFQSENEKKIYDNLNVMYEERLQDLRKMLVDATLFDDPAAFSEYIQKCFLVSVRKKNEVFTLAHTSIAIQLLNNMTKIHISLEEILERMRKNLQRMAEEHENKEDQLIDQLYDANKMRISACRLEAHRNSHVAQLDCEIRKIQERIECLMPDQAYYMLEQEVQYWEKRLAEFIDIEQTANKLQKELKNVKYYLAHYEKMTCNEYPGSNKMSCWENMGENFRKRIKYAQEALLDTGKAIVTFFAVRGQNRIFYNDADGRYALDDYGHKIYHFDYGKRQCHVLCDGTYKEFDDTDKYYYDKWGRYIIENGEKFYQCAPCTSKYKLTDDELLIKVTKDCGHTFKPMRDCKMELKDRNEIELLPSADPVDIKGTLQSDVVKYLWNSFGHVLADALYDVGKKQPLNPIYYLGNRILYHKYRENNLKQLHKKKVEASKFRSDVYRKRHERAMAARKAWKDKQVKPSKPEDLDDADTHAVMALDAYQNLQRDLMLFDSLYDYTTITTTTFVPTDVPTDVPTNVPT